MTYDVSADHLKLWVPYSDPRQILWFGKSPSAASAKAQFDVDDARYTSQLPSYLSSRLNASTTLYVIHDQRPSSVGAGDVNATALQPAMDRARVTKDSYEVALIRRANDISSQAHLRVAERFLKMTSERDMEALFLGVSDSLGATHMAYPVIAGGGPNGSTLHYGENNMPLRRGDNVVFDAGAEFRCYASDITRTLPVGGKFSVRGQAIMDIVSQMQNECINAVKPGVLFYDLHLHAAKVAAEGLKKLGVLRGSREEIAAAGTVSAFFPHGLGHHVGLEVHDVPGSLPLSIQAATGLEFGKREFVGPETLAEMRYPSKAVSVKTLALVKDRATLRPGMVVTVEPGVYFCREYLEGFFKEDSVHSKLIDWDVLEKYYPVGGARTEDCILVTDKGYDNLSVAPKMQALLDTINA